MEVPFPAASCRPSPSRLGFPSAAFSHLSSYSVHASRTLTVTFPFPLHRNHSCPRPRHPRTLALQRSEHDVVVVGAGIIGLTIARQFLHQTDLSVAVLDARVPCYGATGAGQGYIWMAYRTPGDATWDLSLRSLQLWEDMAESLKCQGMDPLQELGWQKTGSLLVGRTSREPAILERRVEMFSDAGLMTEYLSSTAMLSKEPEIDVGEDGGAAFFPNDCQLDAIKAACFIEKGNRYFVTEGRYTEFYNNPAVSMIYNTRGEIEAIQTPDHILYCRKAVVISAGAWSGTLMQNLLKSNNVKNVPVKPRKGHLVVAENVGKIQLNHGIMELGYIDHLKSEASDGAKGAQYEEDVSVISMTATIDTMGNLVLGSSRQFCGFSTEVDDSIVKKIWEHAGEFLPSIRKLTLDSIGKNIRVGLRPWMPDGRPVIGPLPGLPNVVVATGHEGSGLCMALGTAEMVVDLIIGNPTKISHEPFSFRSKHALDAES